MSGSKRKKPRINLQLSEEAMKHLDKLKRLAGTRSYADAIRQAIRYYDAIASYSSDVRVVGKAAEIWRNMEPLQPPGELVLKSIIEPVGKSDEGELIRAQSVPFLELSRLLEDDWSKLSQISSREWEEIIAAAFDREGFDEVILTPRSGDHGRDVIAVRHGVGSIRIIDSVKAYKPGHLVSYDDVRSLAGVLSTDHKASKGIITTTSDFPPEILKDPFLAPLLPYRLELMNGKALVKWLEKLAKKESGG